MKKLLNTLYINTDGAYLSLDGENVVVQIGKQEAGRIPLHTIDGIITYSYTGASPSLLGKCAAYGKQVTFMTPGGKFLYRSEGKVSGNIFLRKRQYFLSEEKSLQISKNMISAKIKNSAAVVRRTISDHAERINTEKLTEACNLLKQNAIDAFNCEDKDSLRGLEGSSASTYFHVFDDMILQNKSIFFFKSRNRRPPMDNVNALLSFSYALLTNMCVSALEAVGLDPYEGVFHTERPGRCSLALDLVEEFRAPFADRFVLTAINKRYVSEKSFKEKENGAILLTDEARKDFLAMWQKKKQEVIVHPFLGEKMEWGLLPVIQAQLLAKYIRDDLDDYPPFIWR